MNIKDYFTNVTLQITKAAIAVALAGITAWYVGQGKFTIVFIIGAIILFLVATLVQAAAEIWGKGKSKEAYFWVVMSEQQDFTDNIKANVDAHFQPQGIVAATIAPIISVQPFSIKNWRAQLDRVLQQLPGLIVQYQKLHFVCATQWLWAFALGTRLGDTVRAHFHLYHQQGGKLYPVWKGESSVKLHMESRGFALPPGTLVQQATGNQLDAAALIVVLGRDTIPQVTLYLQEMQPNMPIWSFRKHDALDPQKPDQWLQIAAELAKAIEQISQEGDREIYLFGSAPAALALMAGCAVGRFRHLHLCQHFVQNNEYRELLKLPLDGS